MTTKAGERAGRSGGQAMVLGTVLLWGTQVPVLYVLADRWDPFTLNVVRYAIALAVFAALLRVLEAGPSLRPALTTGRSAALGGLMAGFGLLYTASAMLGDPVATAAVAAVMPLTASLVSWAVTGAAPTRRHMVALAVVLPAGALVTPVGAAGEGHPVLGVGLMLAAQATWALYSLLAQSWMPGRSQLRRTAVSVAASLPWYATAFALALTFGLTRPVEMPPMASDAVLILYVTLGPLATGVVLWNAAVARLGLPAAALYLNLVPVVGIVGAAVIGLWPGPLQVLGAAAMIAAMILFARRRERCGRPREAGPP